MLSCEIKVNDRLILKAEIKQIEVLSGTEHWRKYHYRIWVTLLARTDAETGTPFRGIMEGQVDHNREHGAGILIAKVMEEAYGESTV